jgi:hypothetical protein
MMRCRKIQYLLPEFLEGSLSPELTTDVESHLAGCEVCNHELANYRRTIELLGQDTLPEMEKNEWASLHQATMARVMISRPAIASVTRVGEIPGWFRGILVSLRGIPVPALATAALIFLVAGMILFHLRGTVPGITPIDLSPDSAASICNDPHIWAKMLWTEDSDSTTDASKEDAASESLAELLETDGGDSGNSQSLDESGQTLQDDDLWQLLDRLDEQGRALLVADLTKNGKA